MYESHFGFTEKPFSIAPNPRYLYMSAHHREAMAHLVYGVGEGGGFVQLTGEVGTGKTTLCRQLLEEMPADVDVALILNPRIDELELMQTICDELRIDYPADASIKTLLNQLNAYLLTSHGNGRHTVLIIDEAQNLSTAVLEQIRLLTNLETTRRKLLQIILVGQPELRETLAQKDLRQLAQRVTARYHLKPLDRREMRDYIAHRLQRAGCERPVFSRAAVRRVFNASGGIPRLANVICDRALLGAYSRGRDRVTGATVSAAAREVRGDGIRSGTRWLWWLLLAAMLFAGPVAAYRLGWLPPGVSAEIDRLVSKWREWSFAGPVALIRVAADAHAADGGPALKMADDPSAATPRLHLSDRPGLQSPRDRQAWSEDLARFLDELDSEDAGRVSALRLLTGAWELPDSLVFDCVTVREFGLRCFETRDDWRRVLAIDRPAVVRLADSEGRERHVVLYRVDGNHVYLDSDAGAVRATWAEFEARWVGGALVFWRQPPISTIPIDERAPEADLLWLRRALNLEALNYAGRQLDLVELAVFDTPLLDRLHDFQRRAGLEMDDAAGEPELIILNTRLGFSDAPTLRP